FSSYLPQTVTRGKIALRCIELLHVGHSGTIAERCDVGSQLRGLLFIELRLLDPCLRTVGLQGHASGADLEVNCRGTYADETGTGLRSLCVHAVAGGAVGREEFLAFLD